MIQLLSVFRDLMNYFTVALGFLPDPVSEFFTFVVGFFQFFLIAKLFRLLWDLLPAV